MGDKRRKVLYTVTSMDDGAVPRQTTASPCACPRPTALRYFIDDPTARARTARHLVAEGGEQGEQPVH
jgi:hypothetical protein